MSDPTAVQPPYGESWHDIIADGPAVEPPVADESPIAPTPRRGRGVARAAGLAIAGLLAGIVGVSAVQAASGGTPTGGTTADPATAAGQGAAPGQAAPPAFSGGQVPPGFGRFGGGSGEQRLVGTLAAVGRSSVTVQTNDGTSTYAVTSATDIERNGQPVALSALRVGDAVLLHLLPSGSGYVAERVLAGASDAPGGPTGAQPPTSTGRTT